MPVPIRCYRVMFSDGATLDVLAHQDDSRMREWAIERHYGHTSSEANAKKHPEHRIVGVADLGHEFDFLPRRPRAKAPEA